MAETYQKINTLYKRYAFDGKSCPNPKWLKFRNKIILGDFSNKEAEFLFDMPWEAYSKIDGTNSKIIFYPSTQTITVGGKSDNASSQHGQFEMLQEIADKIKPILCEIFPKECAKFAPIKNKETNRIQYYDINTTPFNPIEPTNIENQSMWGVQLEEVPIYIYGEYFGEGIQKCGRRYIEKGNGFVVFDIKQQGWWTPKDVRDSLCSQLGLETVPFIGVMSLREIEEMVKKGFHTKYTKASDPTLMEEGIVARPTLPLMDTRGNRIIVKVKVCDYIDYYNARKDFTNEEFNEFSDWYNKIELNNANSI